MLVTQVLMSTVKKLLSFTTLVQLKKDHTEDNFVYIWLIFFSRIGNNYTKTQ